MSDPRRQLIGRWSKAAGETFERWITNACEFYLRNGWAHIEKTPEPYRLQEKQCTILILEGVELKDENTENRSGPEAEQN